MPTHALRYMTVVMCLLSLVGCAKKTGDPSKGGYYCYNPQITEQHLGALETEVHKYRSESALIQKRNAYVEKRIQECRITLQELKKSIQEDRAEIESLMTEILQSQQNIQYSSSKTQQLIASTKALSNESVLVMLELDEAIQQASYPEISKEIQRASELSERMKYQKKKLYVFTKRQ